MGATNRVSGAVRRAVTGVRAVLPGGPEPVEPATASREGSVAAPAKAPATKAPATKAPAKKPTATKAPAAKKPATPAPAKATAAGTAPTSATTTKPASTSASTKAASKKSPAPTAQPQPAATRSRATEKPSKRAAAKPAAADQAPARPSPEPVPGTDSDAAAPGPSATIGPSWTDEELAGFRTALDAEVQRLREELETGEADLARLIADSGDGAGDDQADAGAKTFEREHEMSVHANIREMLDQAVHAQARLDDGTYGVCESCGGPIAAGRLRAFPRVTLCIACKQAEERR
jgi:RNA polymerase-binding transcription factor DksA